MRQLCQCADDVVERASRCWFIHPTSIGHELVSPGAMQRDVEVFGQPRVSIKSLLPFFIMAGAAQSRERGLEPFGLGPQSRVRAPDCAIDKKFIYGDAAGSVDAVASREIRQSIRDFTSPGLAQQCQFFEQPGPLKTMPRLNNTAFVTGCRIEVGVEILRQNAR